MHYFQFEIKEWISNTAHLSLEEEGAYLRLILYYYDSEQPIQNEELSRIFRRCRIKEDLGCYILNEYFECIDNKYWVHNRCDEVIQKYNLRIESASKAGKLSAQARFNKRSTTVQLINNQESLINNQKPKKPKGSFDWVCPVDINSNIFFDFMAIRKAKKAPLTQTALNGLYREAEKANLDINDALKICCERGWVGFKAEWVENKTSPKSSQDWRNNDALMIQKANELGLHTVGLQRFEIINKINETLRSRV
jgi:uncharacterized protein YdaU (DUF1376 family)